MKTKAKNVLKILMILCLIIATILLAQFAWAKYLTIIKGKAEAQIAEFNFIVNDKSSEQKENIIFAVTRTDNNTKVAQNMLAPGTYGEIPINIDASGTQTFVEYTISIALENKPENLNFYYDKERTLEINVNQIDYNNSEFSRKGFLSFLDNDLSRTEYIYWEWPLETGETEEKVTENDIKDSAWMDTIMTMSIGVKGMQVAEKPMYYAANYGDVVNYEKNGVILKGRIVNKIADMVEIMPVNSDTLKAITVGNVRLGYNSGTTNEQRRITESISSYNNSIKLLNDEAKKSYTTIKTTRALTIEDVNRLTGYDASKVSNNYIIGKFSKLPTEANIAKFIVDELTQVITENDETMKAIELEGIDSGDVVVIGQTYGNKKVKSIIIICSEGESTNCAYSYNDLFEELHNTPSTYFDQSFLMASRCLYNAGDGCAFCVRNFDVNNGYIAQATIYKSSGWNMCLQTPVVPVGYIQLTNIQPKKMQNGEWEIID